MKKIKNVLALFLAVMMCVCYNPVAVNATDEISNDESTETTQTQDPINTTEETTENTENKTVESENNTETKETETTKTKDVEKVSTPSTKEVPAAKATSVTDEATLDAAIAAVNAGTENEITIANSFAVTATKSITKDCTINGANSNIVITSPVQLFTINGNANVTLSNFIIDGTASTDACGLSVNSGVLNLNKGLIIQNYGIFDKDHDRSTVNPSCGGVYVSGASTLNINDGSVIKNCFGQIAGGVQARGSLTRVNVNGTLTGNTSTGDANNGGALQTYDGTIVLYDDCIIDNNKTLFTGGSGSGGAINISSIADSGCKPGKLIMYGGFITGNEADAVNPNPLPGQSAQGTKKFAKDAGGGGIAICRGDFVMYGGTISYNTASYGGGVSVNNEGSRKDYAGYFYGLGGAIVNNHTWATETKLGDGDDVPIINNAPNVSAQAWGKVVLSKNINVGDSTRVGLPFKADINVDTITTPSGTNLEVRNAHELYVARDTIEEEDALNSAYKTLSSTGGELENYYQIGFHSTDKTNYTTGRETRWFMGTVSTAEYEKYSTPTEANIANIITAMNTNNGYTADKHNTSLSAPKTGTGTTTVRISYPDYTSDDTHDYKILYLPYDEVYGTAGTPQVLDCELKSDGIYVTVKGECFGVFEVEKKANPATVIFKANGGTGTMANMTINNVIDYDNTRTPINIVEGTPLTANSFTAPEGYEFAGWSTEPYGLDGLTTTPGAGKDYADQEKIRPNAAETITLYAKWIAKANENGNPATVTFHANYDQPTVEQYLQSVPAKVDTHLNDNYFTRDGYDFVEWNTNPGGSGTTYKNEDVVNLEAEANLDLYAIWSEHVEPEEPVTPDTPKPVNPTTNTSNKTTSTKSVKTGDETNISLFGITLVIAAVGILSLLKKKKEN
ncbi:MAG: InlB B-repeat-containing protein [Thomasclavelia sp.]|nr:InlB B-repeat-containing protein [Thomasclavelia sp.]